VEDPQAELPKNVGGRPPKLQADEATMKQIGGLGRIQATTRECAAWFGVVENTFLKFLTDNPEARQALDDGKQVGLTSLRRTQFRLAEKNAAMAIFLGKNYLGQTDKQEIDHSSRDGSMTPTTIILQGVRADDAEGGGSAS
jgi:hypothetical protein